MACDASFLKHHHTPVIHFGILHFKNEETLCHSAGPISRYSQHFFVTLAIIVRQKDDTRFYSKFLGRPEIKILFH